MTYKEIRKITPQLSIWDDVFVSWLISARISPWFTSVFLKFNVIPNTITLLMIISGIIGSILFSLPYLWLKIIGFVFFHIWFILDCSDGEVARITKKFSTYGKEMDYMAHLICHPLFNLTLWFYFVKLNIYNTILLSLIFLCFISMELIIRSFNLFNTYLTTINSTKRKRPSFLKYIIGQFIVYPNFILIFPLFILIDNYFETNYSFYILLCWLSLYSIIFFKVLYNYLKRFYCD